MGQEDEAPGVAKMGSMETIELTTNTSEVPAAAENVGSRVGVAPAGRYLLPFFDAG